MTPAREICNRWERKEVEADSAERALTVPVNVSSRFRWLHLRANVTVEDDGKRWTTAAHIYYVHPLLRLHFVRECVVNVTELDEVVRRQGSSTSCFAHHRNFVQDT